MYEVRGRRNYLWVPTTPSPPPGLPKSLPPLQPSPSREPSFLSGLPPPSISPHSSPSAAGHTSSFNHHGEKKEQLPPSYDGNKISGRPILGLDAQYMK